ncbi:MAG: SDR family NAD(P)-dependent oxidoreductase, partial [Actinobacteria bacterium]|nr:SDR family NAD(P)-dependent oxidoreductase [Actinomycetota bacterium]
TAFGGIDTWVHAAAVALYARFEDTTPAEFARVIEVNLLGQVHGALAALPRLRERGQGAFISISSVEARRAFPYHSAYAAAKHGVDGFLEALRVELREEGVPIAVTNVMPGSINTPLFDKARTKLGVKPQPPPPIYEPETVARVILHAARHPARDLVAGGAGAAIVGQERLSPAMFDALLVRLGFRTQRTDEPKRVTDPDNLFEPIVGFPAERGNFHALRHSAFNWLETHAPTRPIRALASRPPRLRDSPEPAYYENRAVATARSLRARLVDSATS